jgi:hypothetical protein
MNFSVLPHGSIQELQTGTHTFVLVDWSGVSMRKSFWTTIAVGAATAAVGGCVEVPVALAASKLCQKSTGHRWHSAINSGSRYTSEVVGNVTCAQAACPKNGFTWGA